MDIYIGNLNYNLTESEIQKLFEVFGDVLSVTLVVNKHTGQSKGYGFVHMRNKVEASRAVDELDRREVAGRQLVVHFSHSADEHKMAFNLYSEKQKERFLSNNELKEKQKPSTKTYNKSDVDENGHVKIKFS